jgi:hypothetical protein
MFDRYDNENVGDIDKNLGIWVMNTTLTIGTDPRRRTDL